MTKAERYKRDVKCLPCEICVRCFNVDPEPQTDCVSDAHHPRTGAGAGRKNSDEDVCALCKEHHQGSTGIHGLGRKLFERTYGVTEAELTASTQQRVAEMRARRV